MVAPGTNGYSQNGIQSLVIAPSNGQWLYASSRSGGSILSSTDGGQNWATHETDFYNYFSMLAVDPTNHQIVYAARPCDGSGRGGTPLIRSTDGGATWEAFVGTGATALSYKAFAVAVDIHKIYVGTEMGVYESKKTTASWTKLDFGLPNVRVVDLELHETRKLLAAGTLGRGLWRLKLP